MALYTYCIQPQIENNFLSIDNKKYHANVTFYVLIGFQDPGAIGYFGNWIGFPLNRSTIITIEEIMINAHKYFWFVQPGIDQVFPIYDSPIVVPEASFIYTGLGTDNCANITAPTPLTNLDAFLALNRINYMEAISFQQANRNVISYFPKYFSNMENANAFLNIAMTFLILDSQQDFTTYVTQIIGTDFLNYLQAGFTFVYLYFKFTVHVHGSFYTSLDEIK